MTTTPAILSGSVYVPQSALPDGTIGVVGTVTGGYVSAAPSDFHAAVPPAVPGAITNVFSGSKTVSPNFFGLTYHRWPGGTTNRPTTLFKVARSHDFGPGVKRVRWSSIESAQGVFDWSALDDFVAEHKAAGRSVIHTLYGSPSWASARPAEASSYGPGVAAEPANLAHWDAYCAACANRYAGQIDYYEVWNEPNLPGFYTGTQTLLAQMTRRASQTIKAIDPAAKIISPAVTALQSGNGQAYFAAMMAASDGAAGNMAAWTDVVGVHLYPNNAAGVTAIPTMMATFFASLPGLGLSGKPVFNTEFGMLSPVLRALSPEERKSLIARMLLLTAVCSGGCDASIWYSGDADSNVGLLPEDDAWWNAFRALLTSAPVTVVNTLRDGRVAAVIGGSSYVF